MVNSEFFYHTIGASVKSLRSAGKHDDADIRMTFFYDQKQSETCLDDIVTAEHEFNKGYSK